MPWCGLLQVCSSRAKLWSNKQRQLKQLPDQMRNRKPMSGAAETYPVSDHPKHKVNGAVDSQDVFKELSRNQAQRKEDGLGEFYD
jgi:hypothetical protein